MGLESDIQSDFRQLLTEHGVQAWWQGLDLLVLVSRIRREQQIEMGGFVESPELSQRVEPFGKASLPPPAIQRARDSPNKVPSAN